MVSRAGMTEKFLFNAAGKLKGFPSISLSENNAACMHKGIVTHKPTSLILKQCTSLSHNQTGNICIPNKRRGEGRGEGLGRKFKLNELIGK